MNNISAIVLSVLFLCGCSGNVEPTADAGPDQVALVGAVVTLDGSASSDHDNDVLTYRWRLTTVPDASTAALTAPGTVNPTFIPDIAGEYIAELAVSDDDWTTFDTTVITALTALPGPDGRVPILVFHAVDAISAWETNADIADAVTILNTNHPELVDAWNAGLIIATQILVPAADAFHPERYEVVDWTVTKRAP